MSQYETHTLSVVVKPADQSIYSEMATIVEITDDAGGPFVTIKQNCGADNCIAINPEEWPAIRAAIDHMFGVCATMDRKTPIGAAA